MIEGNINEALGNIQQRREKLRQDSLQRKKLIEDVMNRKREFCSNLNTTTASPQANSWKAGEDFYRRVVDSCEKDNSKSYLSKTSQRGANYYKQQIQQ